MEPITLFVHSIIEVGNAGIMYFFMMQGVPIRGPIPIIRNQGDWKSGAETHLQFSVLKYGS